jgi:hypothetical protein
MAAFPFLLTRCDVLREDNCHAANLSARARRGQTFHGPFYGLEIFGCKSEQFYVTRCKPYSLGLPMICNAVQHSEKVRNLLVLKYKSAALEQLSYAGAQVDELPPGKIVGVSASCVRGFHGFVFFLAVRKAACLRRLLLFLQSSRCKSRY